MNIQKPTDENIDTPDWSEEGYYWNWKNYILDEHKEAWSTLSAETRLALYKTAQNVADNEGDPSSDW